MSALSVSALSPGEARSLTDEVKGDAERLWRKLVELYEGGAHGALGYSSWGAYFKTEFGGSRARAYQLLEAGRVMEALESVQHVGLPKNDRQAKELAPLLKTPDALREAWAEVVEHHSEPTAADVREVVARHVEPREMSHKETINSEAARRKLYTALSSIDGYCSGIDSLNYARIAAVATQDDLASWERSAANAIAALNRMRRALNEKGVT